MNNYFVNIENFIYKKHIYNYPIEIQDRVKYVLQNGKRLRPILCLIFSNVDNTISNEINYNEINNYNLKTNTDII